MKKEHPLEAVLFDLDELRDLEKNGQLEASLK